MLCAHSLSVVLYNRIEIDKQKWCGLENKERILSTIRTIDNEVLATRMQKNKLCNENKLSLEYKLELNKWTNIENHSVLW